MSIIANIGMDVHTTNYTLCAYSFESQEAFAKTQIKPDINELVKYLTKLQKHLGEEAKLVCGYEAGGLGYSLYHQLTERGYKCVILAPSTIPKSVADQAFKDDWRDAVRIAECLTYGTYKSVYVPDDNDIAVKEYIRMRDGVKTLVKQTKQRIIAFYHRYGILYQGTPWTQKHFKWLRSLEWKHPLEKEAFEEEIITLEQLLAKIERYDRKIEEIAQTDRYAEKVNHLCCFKGIRTHTALSHIVEVSDFRRFPSAEKFAAFLGLVPGRHDSSDKRGKRPISKTGNSHLRRLLIESAQSFCKGTAGRKSKALKERQQGNSPEIIAYADRANERLSRKYRQIAMRSSANVAKTAVAREMACFIWGMMNEKYN